MHTVIHQLIFITLAWMVFIPAARSAETDQKEKGVPPNILLYVVDDQGSGDAGCYGNPVIKTPGLDDLAANGTRFTRAFCTTASCSASRSVILTGLHNHANGQYGHEHGYNHFQSFDHVRSLPSHLAEAGYRTGRAGKYHVAPEDVYPFGKVFRGGSPGQMADHCREFIAESSDRPFFLYFCTHEPHRPFKREGSDPISPEEVMVPSYLPDSEACRKELAQYYMSVQRADSGLLRLIAILRETGHWEDTVILFCSDNGIAFPGAKTNLYEPAMRLPFVFRDPTRATQGTVREALISYTDITPTLLDYAGVRIRPNTTHGRSFRPVLQADPPEGWDAVFASHTFHEITMYYPMRVLREDRWKLIWNIAHGLEYPHASDLWASPTWQAALVDPSGRYAGRSIASYSRRPAFELYDLQSDPGETRNLAGATEHAARFQAMQQRLRAFQKRTGDPWKVKWVHE